ncbi:MAG: TIGR02302 family protein [Paracoccaceae bacterium]
MTPDRAEKVGYMAITQTISETALRRLRWPLALTRAGMLAESVIRAFWPLLSVILLVLAGLMFGLHEAASLEIVWIAAALTVLGAIAALKFGFGAFHWPTQAGALARLDAALPGRPITAILDEQVFGSDDPASVAVWQAHVTRMAARVGSARAVEPDLRVSSHDPYALRYAALLAFVMALLFGSILRISSVTDLVPGQGGAAFAAGPNWEGWLEPPTYTGKPSIYLADVKTDDLTVPVGSRLTLRLYGEIGVLTVAETISGRLDNSGSVADPSQSFEVAQSGTLAIEGPGGRIWNVQVTPDGIPVIAHDGEAERGLSGDIRLPFLASDDYGVRSGYAELSLDLETVDRRFGLAGEPEPRDLITLDLPMPFGGERTEIRETLIDNLSQHPWAGLPVRVSLFATDASAQIGSSATRSIILPGRRFFDPLASALIEQRRYLHWTRENAPEVASVLRALSHRPDDIFESPTAYLKLRMAMRRLELGFAHSGLSLDRQAEIAQVLWDVAVLIEDGNFSDALERLRRAQERLEQAMREGVTDEEIAELMEELRQAMQDYMAQLAEQAQDNNQFSENRNGQEFTGDQLQELLDRLQELMEQGRMAEAQQLLDQLRQMMENLQITQGQRGQRGPGQQALDGLADTLRQQQGLSDDTFGDLQDQFGPEGEQQGQFGDQGRQGLQGQQGQQGQRGQQPGDGRGQGLGLGNDLGRLLADRQQVLRNQLDQQSRNLPGAGTPGGQTGREELDRAGRAMDGAEQALRQDDFAGALDRQAEALEALREGIRQLSQELAEQQLGQFGQQGDVFGRGENDNNRDPLGRDAGAAGRVGTDEQMLQGDDVYRRAQELIDEIRRRSSEQDRPEIELDYLKRLLDRF